VAVNGEAATIMREKREIEERKREEREEEEVTRQFKLGSVARRPVGTTESCRLL
jgi:hypothetical protein